MIIEYGYDRHVKSWNVVVLDREGNIIASEYVGDMIGVNTTIKEFESQFEISEVKKIKAY